MCDDGRRQYIWALLDPKNAIRSNSKAIRIVSPGVPGDSPTSQIPPPPNRITMPQSNSIDNTSATSVAQSTTNGQSEATSQAPTNGQRVRVKRKPKVGTTLDQATALRDSLRRSAGEASDLVRLLKRQRRESQLVQSTLASLKQLQQAG